MKRTHWIPSLVFLASIVLLAPGAVPAAHAQAAGAKPTASTEVDSLPFYEKAVARDSSKFDNTYHLGVLYMDRDRPAEAVRVFSRALKSRPKDLKTLVNLGAANDALGAPDKAQEYYKQALTVSPGDSVAMCRMASSLYAQGKYQESVDALRKVIASKPSSHCAYFTLGVAFADAGLYKEAVKMWQKVIELAPASAEATSARESIDILSRFIGQ